MFLQLKKEVVSYAMVSEIRCHFEISDQLLGVLLKLQS